MTAKSDCIYKRMEQRICLQSWVPVRASNSSKSEMVTSMLFGEVCAVIGKEGEWLHVRLIEDGYLGWVPDMYLRNFSDYAGLEWVVLRGVGAFLLGDKGDKIMLSPGSCVPRMGHLKIDGVDYHLRGGLVVDEAGAAAAAEAFLNAPYLWGGRSIWGVDCSGLVQAVGKMLQTPMPRDAYQQAESGSLQMWDQRKSGHLAYFANVDGKVTHVGILMDENHIIHAYGKVRIDILTAQGIVNAQTGLLTHKLFGIRTWSQNQ